MAAVPSTAECVPPPPPPPLGRPLALFLMLACWAASLAWNRSERLGLKRSAMLPSQPARLDCRCCCCGGGDGNSGSGGGGGSPAALERTCLRGTNEDEHKWAAARAWPSSTRAHMRTCTLALGHMGTRAHMRQAWPSSTQEHDVGCRPLGRSLQAAVCMHGRRWRCLLCSFCADQRTTSARGRCVHGACAGAAGRPCTGPAPLCVSCCCCCCCCSLPWAYPQQPRRSPPFPPPLCWCTCQGPGPPLRLCLPPCCPPHKRGPHLAQPVQSCPAAVEVAGPAGCSGSAGQAGPAH